MLKLIYTETDLHMELLTANLEDWVKQRLLFSDSTGEIIFLSSETASFLLPTTICEATAINFYLYHQGAKTVTANCCDLDRVEIGLTDRKSTRLNSSHPVSSRMPSSACNFKSPDSLKLSQLNRSINTYPLR